MATDPTVIADLSELRTELDCVLNVPAPDFVLQGADVPLSFFDSCGNYVKMGACDYEQIPDASGRGAAETGQVSSM